MDRFSLKNDYSEGAHPFIIEALAQGNALQQKPYGEDVYCIQAKEKIFDLLKTKEASIHFVPSGTMANILVISHLLKPYEAVISAETGHINVHETGSIESIGHKIISVPTEDGKLNQEFIEDILSQHQDEHKVRPKMVYLSQSNELGRTYCKQEIENLHAVCKQNGLYLYLDGARLAQAITAPKSDLTLSDLAKLTDVFYIGGTKNGALFGEALVFNQSGLDDYFRYTMKQKGALLAKGRTIGIQFDSLFTNNLFFELGKKANDSAQKIGQAFIESGFKFHSQPDSNMLFPILPIEIIEHLLKRFDFYVWKNLDNRHQVARLVTSWATSEEAVRQFIAEIKKL